MAAPTLQALHSPSGQQMPEGFVMRIANSIIPTASFWVISVKPGGVDGGDPIPATTQHNLNVETQRAPQLVKANMCECKVAFDPKFIDQMLDNLCNVEGTISEYYPNGDTRTYYGYFGKFVPDNIEIRKRPEGTLTIYETNVDSNGDEFGPVYAAASGT